MEVFDIVSSLYSDCCTGKFKQSSKGVLEPGLFLVVSINPPNLVGLKITSDLNLANDKTLKLKIVDHPFLLTESLVQIDKPNTLLIKKSRVIGSLNFNNRRTFINLLTKHLGQMRIELDRYAPAYISPNKIKKLL